MTLLDDNKPIPFPKDAKPRPGPDGPAKRIIRVLRQWELMNEPELEDQIEGVIHARTLNLISAQKGQGKTQIAVELGMCIATGQDWAGRKVKLRGPVIYIIGEDADGLRARVIATRLDLGIGERNLPFDIIEEPINLVAPAVGDLNSIIVAIDALGYDQLGAIFLDTYSTVIGGEKEDEKTGGAVAGAGQTLVKEFKCSVFIVHHLGKDKTKGPRGSGVVLDRCSTAISVRQSGNTIALCDDFQRNRPDKQFRPHFKTITASYTARSGRKVFVPRAIWIEEEVTDTGPPLALNTSPEQFLTPKQKAVWKALGNALASDKGFTGHGPNVPRFRCVSKTVWRDEAINLDFYPDAEPDNPKGRRRWSDARTKNFNDVAQQLVSKGMCQGYGSGLSAVYWKVKS